MKSKSVYYRSYNAFLDLCKNLGSGRDLPTMTDLSIKLEVSRTTIRAVLAGAEGNGILERFGSHYRIRRTPKAEDYFEEIQTLSASASVERQFLELILDGHVQSGELLTTTDLARRFNTSTTTVREHLPHLQHFGLIERRANSAWLFKGFTDDFAEEIYEVREMFELRAVQALLALPDTSPGWRAIRDLQKEHLALLSDIDVSYHSFAELDERLHRLIHELSHNRYIRNFYEVISIVFHYNYKWKPIVEKDRAQVALKEHLAYLDAILARDPGRTETALKNHLNTSRDNLVRIIREKSRSLAVDSAASS